MTSLKRVLLRKRKKVKNFFNISADDGNNKKFDQEGNVLEEFSGDEDVADSEVEEDPKSVVLAKDTKKTKKTKK